LKISNASSQTKHEHLSSLTDNKRSFRKSQRQLLFTTTSVSAAQYQKWVFTDFLKCITISDKMLYNLKFKLPQISQHIHLLIHSEVFESSYKSLSKIIRSCQASTCYQSSVTSSLLMKWVLWTNKENSTVVKMKKKNCLWNKICVVLLS